ncbi:nodulation protein NfeD [Paenibacillus septentrionalis]|uniref:Nodulation protein NfeD n=1 Tax=Paenibacillus septentrionalis TaxID=429342 RepID=A0ABW1V4T6_9BACL
MKATDKMKNTAATKWLVRLMMMLALVVMVFPSIAFAQSKQSVDKYGPAVYHIPLKGDVEPAMAQFLKRALTEAEEAHAEHIIITLNTYGGRTDSAAEIGEMLRSTKIPITAFIEGKAVSAGTYIALNADTIVMQEGSTMGSAAVVDGSGKLIDNPKTISFWVDQMSEAAKLNGRDPNVAIAMVDPRIEVDLSETLGKVVAVGDVLAISASDALRIGYSEHTASNLEEVVAWLGLNDRDLIDVSMSFAEQLSRFILHPAVSVLLLIIGFAGIGIELFVPGFGLPGIIGVLAMGLYFFGSYLGGLAGMESAILFIVGILLIILELFVPAFGILGILGGGAVITGIILAAPDWQSGLTAIVIALVIATIIIIIFSRTKKGRTVWSKFVLREKLTTEEGFISADSKSSLVGERGVTATPLRPAGSVLINNQRVDVVTEGGFIEINRLVEVVKAEGTWVVVREISNNEKE